MKNKKIKKTVNFKKEYIVVETPDKIKILYKIATPVLRASSFLIDLLIFFIIIYVIGCIFDYLNFFNFIGKVFDHKMFTALTLFFWYVVIFLLRWFYYLFFEMLFNGKTPGKMILGLRVVPDDGRYLDLKAVVLRNFVRIFDQDLTIFLGATISIIVNKEYRRVGDLIAGTVVIKEEKLQKKAPDFTLIQNDNDKFYDNTKKIVKKLSEEDLYILRKFLNSLDSFPIEKRQKLINNMALSIRKKISDSEDYTDPLEYLKSVYLRHNDE